MADSIKIDTQTLISTAKKVRDLNEGMDQKLADCNKEMDRLGDTWTSDASTEIREAMNALKPLFANYKMIIEEYAKFLDNTAQSYETTEQSIQTNVQSNVGSFK